MAIRINRVYTRTGDKGTTHLVGGAEVAKDSPRIEAFGTVDELNAILGLARTFNEQVLASGATGPAGDAARELEGILMGLQNELFDLGSQLATPPGSEYPGMLVVGDAEVAALEKCIDRCQEDLKPLESFILPGGGTVAAFLHQARTVCRRAERRVIELAHVETIDGGAIRYLNRLSDLLFVMARVANVRAGVAEIEW